MTTPLLLVHGHPFDHTMWRGQVARFGAERPVLAPDLRGFGNDRAPITRWSDFADDLAALPDDTAAVVVGFSMGGQVVLDLQERYPHLVAGLMLVDTSAGPEPDPDARRAAGHRLLREGMATYAEEVLHRMITPAASPEVTQHVLTMMRSADPVAAGTAHLVRADRPDHRPRLGSITVPTAVVVGSDDAFTPLRDALEMADGIPGAELTVVPGAAHMPPLEQPAVFDAALARLLTRVRPRSGTRVT